MGRKSSAKNQNRSSASGSEVPPPDPKRAFSPFLVLVPLVILAFAGFLYVRNAQQTAASGTSAAAAPMTPVDPPEAAKLGPHPQANLPPLPFDPEPPARPMDVVRAAYQFAAEHPEVLGYVPCYCGCERSGHRGNEDCFVSRRDAKGDVVEWEPHGMT
jgi:uncharacterized protein with PCYCGC motif